MSFLFFLQRAPPISTLVPYTTLFRSASRSRAGCPASHFGAHRGSTYQAGDRAAAALPREWPRSRNVPPDSEWSRSEEHTSELQSRRNVVCRLLLEKKKS